MAFPTSPTNGQTATVNNIAYVYASSTNTWTRQLGLFGNISTPLQAVIANATASTSTATGALIVTGGAGITGNTFVGNIISTGFYFANGAPFTSSSYGNTTVGQYLPTDSTVYGIQANIGAYQTYANTASQTINANIGAYYAFGNANAVSQAPSINTINANIGAYQTYANTKIGTNTNSNLVVVATTTSTSTTTGALVVAGGVGVAGNVTAANVVITTSITYANGAAFSSGSTASLLENVKTASYTLALADAGKVVAFDTATDCTVTVPSDATVSFPTGSLVYIFRANTGNVTLANAAGVSLTKTGKFGTYEQIYLRKRAANVWVTVEESGISNGSFSNVNTNGSTTINGIYTIQTWTGSSGNFTISG